LDEDGILFFDLVTVNNVFFSSIASKGFSLITVSELVLFSNDSSQTHKRYHRKKHSDEV
jgi:hypothetical protein